MPAKTYAVFLSFNSEYRAAVGWIAAYLADKANLRPWLDQWELIPGEPWVNNLERGLEASNTCAVFVGKSGEGPWQKREVELALRQQIQTPDFRVIPVLLPDAPKQPKLPSFLAGNMWVAFEKGLDDPEALWRLTYGIRAFPPAAVPPQHYRRRSRNLRYWERLKAGSAARSKTHRLVVTFVVRALALLNRLVVRALALLKALKCLLRTLLRRIFSLAITVLSQRRSCLFEIQRIVAWAYSQYCPEQRVYRLKSGGRRRGAGGANL